MIVPKVAEGTWRRLYAAAEKFKDIVPWEFMNDGDVFAVKDPASGEMGYCCVMGALGQVLALGVYRSDEGLELHQRLQNDASASENIDDIFAEQNCLIAEFVDRDELDPEDHVAIQIAGRKYQGVKAYPRFRSLLPGHTFWFTTEDEVTFLIFALECACDFALRFKQNPEFLDEGGDDEFFTYEQLQNSSGFSAKWKARVEAPKKSLKIPELGELRIKKILKMELSEDKAWELDLFYVPGAIEDRDRPYFCQMAIAVDSRSEFLLGMDMVPFGESPVVAIREVVQSAIEKHKHIPAKIVINAHKTTVSDSLLGLCEALRIDLELNYELPALVVIREELSEQMQKDFGGD